MSKHTSPFDPEYLETYSREVPFFLFSKDLITAKYEEFKACFPGADIHYAMKANSEPELLEHMRDLGSGFEVASIYELHMLQEAGVKPEKIIYGTSVKRAEHIQEFFEYGVDRFACDSFQELEKIAAVAPCSRVYIRTRVDDSGSVFKFSEKFGTPMENIIPMLERARDLGLRPYGISFHVGSQASNRKAWAEGVEALAEIIEKLRDLGMPIEMLDIGGGFPCNKYASAEEDFTLRDIADEFYEAFSKLSYKPHLLMEPGRGIIAETAILVASVIAKVEREQNSWLFLDAGVYNGLFEVMAYQGSTRYKVTLMRPSFNAGESSFALAGPTGDSPDVISREAFLPSDVGVGDRLIFHDVGAYSVAVTSTFNGFPKPAVHFI